MTTPHQGPLQGSGAYMLKMPGDWYKASSADIVDDVRVGKDCSFWFGVVARGDIAPIILGERVNVQDLAVLHVDPGVPMTIEDDVSIAHHACVHGSRVGRGTLIGIGAMILGGSVIGEECIIGAGALVPENRVIPPRSLVVGIPGKVVRRVSDDEAAHAYWRAKNYMENAHRWYQRGSGVPLPHEAMDTGPGAMTPGAHLRDANQS